MQVPVLSVHTRSELWTFTPSPETSVREVQEGTQLLSTLSTTLSETAIAVSTLPTTALVSTLPVVNGMTVTAVQTDFVTATATATEWHRRHCRTRTVTVYPATCSPTTTGTRVLPHSYQVKLTVNRELYYP